MMRILVLGAGATGGYFGGRLLDAGRDVTFLVRDRRAGELAESGLVVNSPFGDLAIADPPVVTTDGIERQYDLVLLSCKAYDLEDAVNAIAPAVGDDTLILPLLNGMRHLDVLDERFGREKVLGGRCVIAATLDDERKIVHLNDLHSITFGARDPAQSGSLPALTAALSEAGFDAIASDDILQEMWEKWVVLATLAGMTCLMRASVGEIVAAPGGAGLIERLFDECGDIARSSGYAPRPKFVERTRAFMTTPGSTLTASMMRDLEAGHRIEGDHIIGDLLARRGEDSDERVSLLQVAYAHLKAYENRRG